MYGSEKVKSSLQTIYADIFLYKPKGFFQFEVVINVLVSSFRFIWIPM